MADASTPGMLQVGARLAHCEIAELIGVGGMGQVHVIVNRQADIGLAKLATR